MEFREVQKFRQPWLWALVGLPMLGIGGAFFYVWILPLVQGKVSLSNLWEGGGLIAAFVVSLGVVWMLYVVRLETNVRSDGIYLRFFPLLRKVIPYQEIESCQAREYRPVREFGGWGVRWGWKGSAWSISGNQGVQLVLKPGKSFLIGSQKAEELAGMIKKHLP